MEELGKKWYVLRAIGGKEKKVKEFIESEADTFLIVNNEYLRAHHIGSSTIIFVYLSFSLSAQSAPLWSLTMP